MTASRQPLAASTADAFDQSHQGRMRSAVVEQIYRSAFGADYPAAAHPSAFYSATTLPLAISALRLSPGNVVADLGCGHGGPGLQATRQTGARLIGIDLSPAGMDLAQSSWLTCPTCGTSSSPPAGHIRPDSRQALRSRLARARPPRPRPARSTPC